MKWFDMYVYQCIKIVPNVIFAYLKTSKLFSNNIKFESVYFLQNNRQSIYKLRKHRLLNLNLFMNNFIQVIISKCNMI